MNEAVKTLLNQYLDQQGVELSNFNKVAAQLENALDSLIPSIVHEHGHIAQPEE